MNDRTDGWTYMGGEIIWRAAVRGRWQDEAHQRGCACVCPDEKLSSYPLNL